MAAAHNGDARALDDLLKKHQTRIYAICRRLASNDADALDAMQEAMLAIVRGLERFDGRAAFTTWSYRVATNACLDELRRRSRRPALGLPDYEQADDAYVGSSAPRDPSETVSAQIDVDAGLAALPEEFRAPVVLRDIAGLDYADIADLLNLAPGTVRSRIARGRARLADALSGNQTDPDQRQSFR
ncbi:MAG: sigma-70 family RNA polymerase sigma factor [Acidimicrobiales bacterium]|nr:sigma-70 family RNA polymerase sigma factor [Acidimicrobiales bacterium]MDG2219190.1 sigma-70 family RNA polymerase sigma factor [Acidimicrobiales bacterium]